MGAMQVIRRFLGAGRSPGAEGTEDPAGLRLPDRLPERPLCESPWKQFLVRPNGDVWPCCFWYTEERLGNLNEQSFAEIWEGASYRRLRWEILTGNLGKNCSVCPVPGIGDVNEESRHHGNLGDGKRLRRR